MRSVQSGAELMPVVGGGSEVQPTGGSCSAEVAAAVEPRLTLVVCSNRPELVERYWRGNLACLGEADSLVVILDVVPTSEARRVADELRELGVGCITNGENLGLAACRNKAIDHCQTDLLVFIDDEVTISRATVAAIRGAFVDGAGVVGVRIRGPEAPLPLPWYVSDRQLHYLAIHTEGTLSTWGACMGFDVRWIRQHGITFRDELGRRGGNLASADDTTFVRELRRRGVPETFLAAHHVHHNIEPHRLGIGYLLRRAYWQGRSEYRRRTPWHGTKKEWLRNIAGIGRSPVRLGLAVLYTGCVLAGTLLEGLRWRR